MTIQHTQKRSAGRLVADCALAATALTALVALMHPEAAQAQMFDSPWSAGARDRAGIAVIIKQAESGFFERRDGSAGQPTINYDTTTLVCGGGGGDSTATANSSCLILNNATGAVEVGQGSEGGQNATSSSSSTSNTADSITSVLQNLQPDQQPAQ
ncbi:MAG: hypothetical protein WD341_11100 [Tistlia sp.]|uniref:hypothetical protein n=1 Tax=Tistlia sp. TaxID=3057121 RepID=UPI0034A58050